MKKSTATAVLLLLASSAGAPLDGAPLTSRAGTIEGTVVRRSPPRARRSANRYPAGATVAHQEDPVPTVAYIVGPVTGAPAGPRRATMSQRDTTFVPAALAVSVGSVVSFPNEDPFFHNVLSFSEAQRFDLGRYPQGESKEVAFETTGVVRIYCEVHEFMRAVVVVTDNPFHAVVAEDGSFRIDGLPAGRYRLALWDVDLGETEQEVAVTDGATTRIEVELGR